MKLTLDALLAWPLDELARALTNEPIKVVAVGDGSTTLCAGSNDAVSLGWAQRYLQPAMTVVPSSQPATYVHLSVENAVLAELLALLPSGRPLPLQMRRMGESIEALPNRVLVRDAAGPVLYVIDLADTSVLAIASPTATNVRDLARQARELVLSESLRDGWIVMHGSAVSQDGRATVFLGTKGAGKSTLALEASERRGCSYISNDRVLLKATDAGVLVRPYPMSVRLGGGTIRASAALHPHLHAYDHLQAALLPLKEQFAHPDKLELCLGELATIVGCEIEREAVLERVVL